MRTYFTLLFLLFTCFIGFGQIKSFRTNLYIVPDGGGSPVLMDGTLTFFDNSYSNSVDNRDARKMFNPGENWGMVRDPYVLIVERRQDIESEDTIFFKMWNTRIITYRIEMIPKYFNANNLSATLIDKYLGSETPVSLTENGYVDFKVTADKNSARNDRFMLVFDNGIAEGLLPLNFTSSEAVFQKNAVSVKWQTANEQSVWSYVIEKSADGKSFSTTAISTPAKNISPATYTVNDNRPFAGASYYRIKAIDIDGRKSFSNVMKVKATNVNAVVSTLPNPASASNIRLRFSGQQAGVYKIRLVNSQGNLVFTQKEQLSTAESEIKLSVSKILTPGIYRIGISGPGGYRNVLSILIKQ